MSEPRKLISDPLDDPARRSRQENAERRRLASIENFTVATLDVPGRGPVRKVPQPHSCRCGRRRYGYVADVAGYPVVLEPSLCDGCQFEEAVSAHDLVELRDEHELIAREVAEFRATWPRISRVLEPMLAATDPERTLVPLGTRARPRRVGALNEADWREFLGRHAAGDGGEFGRLDEVTLTDAQRLAPELFPVVDRNAVALEAGDGVVRSRYPLSVALAAELGSGFVRQRTGEPAISLAMVDVGTRLTPSESPVTVALVGKRGESCFGA